MRKIITLMSVFVFSVLITSSSYASELYANDGSSIEVQVIDKSEIPSGIIIQEYTSEEEVLVYLNEVYDNMDLKTSENQPNTFSTDGDAVVASRSVGVSGTIKLRVSYGTTGNSNTGSISYVSPYTTFTGFTLGFGWTEEDIGYDIRNGKDIYAHTDGTLDYYILVEGTVKLYSKPVSLSGSVAVIH